MSFTRGDHVTVEGYSGVAWWFLGYCDEDSDTATCMMVGDDRKFEFDADILTPLDREDFCGECGQVGCSHDGLER